MFSKNIIMYFIAERNLHMAKTQNKTRSPYVNRNTQLGLLDLQ